MSKEGIKRIAPYLITAIVLSAAAFGTGYLYRAQQSTVSAVKQLLPGAQLPPAVQTLDEQQLRTLVISKGMTLYWLGPRAGATYVLNTSIAGGVSLQVMDSVSGSSDPIQIYYQIATFVFKNAFAITQKAASQPYGVGLVNVDGNAVYYDSRDSKNVYIGLKNTAIEVEIYDPRPDQALTAALLQGNVKKFV